MMQNKIDPDSFADDIPKSYVPKCFTKEDLEIIENGRLQKEQTISVKNKRLEKKEEILKAREKENNEEREKQENPKTIEEENIEEGEKMAEDELNLVLENEGEEEAGESVAGGDEVENAGDEVENAGEEQADIVARCEEVENEADPSTPSRTTSRGFQTVENPSPLLVLTPTSRGLVQDSDATRNSPIEQE